MAQLLAQTAHGDQVLPILEEGVRRDPKSLPLRVALVSAYLSKPDLPAARVAAEDLKTAQPDSPVGFYFAGLAALQQGHLDESQRELEHALAMKADTIEVLQALVRVDNARGSPLRRTQPGLHGPRGSRLRRPFAPIGLRMNKPSISG